MTRSLTALVLLATLGAGCRNAGTIYLVPIGPFTAVSTATLQEHYRDRFGVRVVVLPAVPIDDAAYDPSREQLVAEALIASMRSAYPEESRGAGDVMIGLTDNDMYIRAKTWRFAFSYREDQLGVVSAARMNPVNFRSPADPVLLRSRVRKMLTKNIGILYYHREPSDDPRSVLYSKVLGLEELDGTGELF